VKEEIEMTKDPTGKRSGVEDTRFSELTGAARSIRKTIIDISYRAGTPHIGSALSCVDILVTMYWGCLRIDAKNPCDSDRDRMLFSKGHAATALYATLAERGFFSSEVLDTYAVAGKSLPEHPSPGCAPGIEIASGSLGHGLSIGLGVALSGKIQGRGYRVYVVMSDGECNEGSVWEAAMLAPALEIENLVAIIDFNRWQATGRSETVTALSPLRDKWTAFGWTAFDVDGHDLNALETAFKEASKATRRPTAIIAHTIKGKGVSFMEDDNNWHYRIPDHSEYEMAMKELERS